MIDLRLDKTSYVDLMKLGKTENRHVQNEIQRRKAAGERPKVRGFKTYSKLSEIQAKILRLFCSAITGETEIRNTDTVRINYAKHTIRGGWISWLTLNSESEYPKILEKISKLRTVVEEEKKSGLCRIYLIPVKNEKDGWEGFKLRLDRGVRLVYEEL
jgi:hypothetical protein